jgi:hypothetical protein
MNPSLIPAVDPAGLPGPPWLFHVLLVLTFFLHVLFLNLSLGGTILGAIAHLLSGGRADDPRGALAGRLTAINTYSISMTITTGVAPLLLVQVLYQQFFYTATILLGWIWFGLLGLLMVGYYATYLYKFRGAPTTGSGGGAWLVLSAVLFLLVAMVQVAVNLIHAQPELWEGVASAPLSVLGDPQYLVRLAHFVLAGIAFSALVCTWWSVRQARAGDEVERNRAIARFAWKWALWTVALQVVDGVVLLIVQPRPVLGEFMRGGLATMGPLTVAILLALGLVMMLARVSDPLDSPGTVGGTLAATVAAIAVMVVTRHQLRVLSLEPATSQHQFAVDPQWLNIVLFLILLVAGLALVGYMIRRVLTSPARGDEAA